ncbi:Small COPII coat GTPase SAR1 [Intoshia linei]|uniref:small monomeric GTPase n=1 Tax=Intoshia linei TaxID=1819745 RepID=A0A177B132_9BILA|nr:Small COPII coat GTPase SAR1 [Intoshia linei]
MLKKKAVIVFLGIDNAGKTTLLHMLKDGRIAQHEPTQHPTNEQLTMGGLKINAYDLGGHKPARVLWRDYLHEVDAIVYIIDVADRDRLCQSKDVFDNLLTEPDIQTIPICILGNKIDKASAISEEEIRNYFGLHGRTTGKTVISNIPGRPMELFMSSIVKKQGYGDGFRWLSNLI